MVVNFFVVSFLIVILVLTALLFSKMNQNNEDYISLPGCKKGSFTRCTNCEGKQNCENAGCKVNSNNDCVPF